MNRIVCIGSLVAISFPIALWAQDKKFAIHPNVGTALTYDELEKYQLYPQYKKKAVDSLTFSVNKHETFTLYLHFHNGITDVLSISKKDVFYIHEKINRIDGVHDSLIIGNIKPVVIKRVKYIDTIAMERKRKMDTIRMGKSLFEFNINVLETKFFEKDDYYLTYYHNYYNKIIVDRDHFLPDWDLRFSFLQPASNTRTRAYYGVGIWLTRYFTSSSTSPGAYGYTTSYTYRMDNRNVRETAFNFQFGLRSDWKYVFLIYGLQVNAGSLYSGTSTRSEKTVFRDDINHTYRYEYRYYPTVLFSDSSWDPSVCLNLQFSFKLFGDKKNSCLLNIAGKAGGFFKESRRLFYSVGTGVSFTF